MKKLTATKLNLMKQQLVNFLKDNPGADTGACAEAARAPNAATRHRLLALAGQGYITEEKVVNGTNGGLKTTWWFLRDFVVVDTLSKNPVAVQSMRRRERQRAAAEVPAICILFGPAAPIPPTQQYRVMTGGAPDRSPIQKQGGQGACRRSGWHRANEVSAQFL